MTRFRHPLVESFESPLLSSFGFAVPLALFAFLWTSPDIPMRNARVCHTYDTLDYLQDKRFFVYVVTNRTTRTAVLPWGGVRGSETG